ncbi:MAG: 3'-5' exonuclease [Candidatus Colwellbacteria bacterium]|nr:3'-5' exonuclease [Candidatus Colwellbacteria bacterium]
MPYKHFDIPLAERELSFFDTEATRLDLKAEIIELGAIRVSAREFKSLGEFEIKIKPERLEDANPEALTISGYNEKDWQNAVSKEEGVKKFLEFVNDSILVANNLPFDWMWLQKAVEDLDLPSNYFYKGLDIFSLAWMALGERPEAPNLTLGQLAKYFRVDQGQPHRALDDARTAYKVFLKLIGNE